MQHRILQLRHSAARWTKCAAKALASLVIATAPATTLGCEVKLLLSWDVSPSMSAREYALQRMGTARALLDPIVRNAIARMPGGVAVSIIQWAGPGEQEVSLPWTLLRNRHDIESVSLRIAELEDPFHSFTGTAVGDSLRTAASYLDAGPECSRVVIDISSDGIANSGVPTVPEADTLISKGVDINALVLPPSPLALSGEGDPMVFYLHNVSRSASSFVMDVASYDDYWEALKIKLLRELSPQIARR